MSSLPRKSSQVSKIPQILHYELSRDKKEYFAISKPTTSKIEFNYAKSLKPLHVQNTKSEERIEKDQRLEQRGKILSKPPVKTQLKTLLGPRKDILVKRYQSKKVSPREDIVKTPKVNEILENVLQTVTRLKLSRIRDTEKLTQFLKLIHQIENEVRKRYPKIKHPVAGEDRIIIKSDRIRTPRPPDYRELIEQLTSGKYSSILQDESMPEYTSLGMSSGKNFSQLGSLGSLELKDESMPEYSSLGEASGREKSILASHEMDTQDLFQGGISDPSQLRPGLIDEEFSEIDEESSPGLVGEASGLSQMSHLEKESFPEMGSSGHKSTLGRTSFLDFGEIDGLSEIDEESSPEFASTGHEQLQDESMPDYKSFVESTLTSGQDKSILASHEMNTDEHFSGIDYFPSDRYKSQEIAEQLSQLDEESSPDMFSESHMDLHKESMPHYSSFELSLSDGDSSGGLSILSSQEMDTGDLFAGGVKTSPIRRIFDVIPEGLSEIEDETSPELVSVGHKEATGFSDLFKSSGRTLSDLGEESFPGLSSSDDETSDWDKSVLKSHEMDTQDLFKGAIVDPDQLNTQQKRHLVEIADQSEIDEESSPELVSADHGQTSDYFFESQGKLQDESMPNYLSYVSSVLNQSGRSGSFLESHEMDTEHLFEGGITDPGQLNIHQTHDENLSRIEEESSPELVSIGLEESSGIQDESMPHYTTSLSYGDLNEESFPQVSSTFDHSAKSSTRGSVRNLLKDMLTPRRTQKQNLSSKSVQELSRREEDSAKDAIVKYAFKIVKLQNEELERTRARYRDLVVNVKNVLEYSRGGIVPRESLKQIFDKLEQEVESFVGTPKKLPQNL